MIRHDGVPSISGRLLFQDGVVFHVCYYDNVERIMRTNCASCVVSALNSDGFIVYIN